MFVVLLIRKMNICIKPNILPIYFTNCNVKLYTGTGTCINSKKSNWSNLKLSNTAAPYSCAKLTPLKRSFTNQLHGHAKIDFKDIRYLNNDLAYCKVGLTTQTEPLVKNMLISNIGNIAIDLEYKPTAKCSDYQESDHPYLYTSNSGQQNEDCLPLGPYMKPVSLSLNDIQARSERCGDQTTLLGSSDFRLNKKQSITSKEFGITRIRQNDILSNASPKSLPRETNLHILCCSSSKEVSPTGPDSPERVGKPSEEQLAKVHLKLRKDLPLLFVTSLDYRIYHQDIIFDNRINGKRSVGISSYIRQTLLLRFVGHIKFAFVNFDILKITTHPEDSSVRVRWRILGISALKSLPLVFTLKSYGMKENADKFDQWYDGFSIFYVGGDGRVLKHVADKMMPDEQMELVKEPSIASRLASLVGVDPKVPAAAAVTSSVQKKTVEDPAQSLAATSPVCLL